MRGRHSRESESMANLNIVSRDQKIYTTIVVEEWLFLIFISRFSVTQQQRIEQQMIVQVFNGGQREVNPLLYKMNRLGNI